MSTCRECRFWHCPKPAVVPAVLDDVIGECHRNPPMLRQARIENNWPFTRITDWCGQFVDRELGYAQGRAEPVIEGAPVTFTAPPAPKVEDQPLKTGQKIANYLKGKKS